MTGRLTKFLRDRSGAGAAEFAIVALVLMGTMIAIFDMSRVFFEYNQSVKACQQGVRFAVTNYMVAPGLADFSAACKAGDPLTLSDLPSPTTTVCTCDNISGDPAGCTGTGNVTCTDHDGEAVDMDLAMDAIVREMAKIYPRLATDPDATVTVAYEAIPGGICANSGVDILAMTTVSIGGLQFDFATPLVGSIGNFEFPRCSATLPSEDLATCGTGTSPYTDITQVALGATKAGC
jgi:Flp pilus assembly pilin Flp